MKKILLSLILLLSLASFSQTINDYQYVIVPIKFDFLKENDQYRLNTTTKLLLQKYGFKAFLNSEQPPAEASSNRCSVLYAFLDQNSNMFTTKIKVVLKDCFDKVVFETDYGVSRIKEFAPAYNEALRNAFKSFDKLEYKYNGGNVVVVETVAPAVPEKPTPEVSTLNTNTTSETTEVFYFAQPTPNGFQVVNSEPKVILRLFNTSQKNVFIGTRNNINGVVLSKNGKWVFEYYDSGKLVSEGINLKF